MRLWCWKNLLTSHPELGKLATGIPRALVSIEVIWPLSAAGTAFRSKNQILQFSSVPNNSSHPTIHIRNPRVDKLCHPYSTPAIRKRSTIRRVAGVQNHTPLVLVRQVRAVDGIDECAGLCTAVGPCTARVGVQAHLLPYHAVDAFEGVDFAT